MSGYLSERDRRVMQAFPELFGAGPWEPQTSGMAWGLMVGDGWRSLVLDLLEELATIRREERLDHLQILQIKEKYGGLRVYVSPHTDLVDVAIARAEARRANL